MFYVNFTDHFLDPGRVFGTMDLCACDVCVYVCPYSNQCYCRFVCRTCEPLTQWLLTLVFRFVHTGCVASRCVALRGHAVTCDDTHSLASLKRSLY